ncbi:TadE family protein [Humibacillus xanthopallidus]|uniref:TadE family protein n=1 Tax=Humibacillus xanthopallidus TaxID=412689 RepID=UPI00163B0EA1|nr:TadE family protein [Humibacillus xanthopallidus]
MEFAILLPLVFLIIAGIVDFGTAFFTKIELTNAAREGARAAVITGTPVTAVQARASAAAIGVNGLTVPNPTVCPTPAPSDSATVLVEATAEWRLLKPALNLFGAGSSLPTKLSAQAVMKCGG